MKRRSDGGRLAAAVALLTLIAAALGWWGFERFVRAPVPERAAVILPVQPPDAGAGEDPEAEAERPAQARIVSIKGDVQRSADAGAWEPVQEGETLRQHERIRTGVGGAAELSVDEQSSVMVSESTEVGVVEISRAVHRFKLVRGRVTADYTSSGRRALRIEGAGGQVAMVEQEAKFSVLAAGDTFTLATERGRVNLASAGGVVSVDAGQQASARAEAPAQVTPISADVLLLATGRSGRRGCEEIRGSAAPGSEVYVEGALAEVDADGRFAVALPEYARQGPVHIRTRDALGRVEEKVVTCRADRRQTVNDIAIKNWQKRPKVR